MLTGPAEPNFENSLSLRYQTLLIRGCGRKKQQGCKRGGEGAVQLRIEELHGKVYSQW
jgi:hypothetical protein